MTARSIRLALIAAAFAGTLTLGGCAYDYLQRTDRVAYSAGDAVKANLATQTTDPATTNLVKGLGKDGNLIPPPTTPAAAP